MIEQLVEQIESRFAELSEQMSDPEVIGDQRRLAEVGRAYNSLRPAHALPAQEWRTATSNAEGARGAGGGRPRCAVSSSARRRASQSSRRRSGWRWSRPIPTTAGM